LGALKDLRKALHDAADRKRALVMQRFFKTGKGQYGEGDVFIGLTVPKSRLFARQYSDLPMPDVKSLLHSRIHEERLIALLILVQRFKQAPDGVAAFYLDNLAFVNNWDLVDLSAPCILGAYLEGRDRTSSSPSSPSSSPSLLYRLAKSGVLWERRISMMATLHFIRKGDFSYALKVTELLLCDEHDLVHKAAGWMLREIGKRDIKAEEAFLAKHCDKMPRTMLRYAIEKFPEKKRRAYMEGAAP
jgi:3-methyladenine DNA glycosylase AlkD